VLPEIALGRCSGGQKSTVPRERTSLGSANAQSSTRTCADTI
jgi:hypothetical protein